MLAYLHGLKFSARLRVFRTVLTPASAMFGKLPLTYETRDLRCLVSLSRAFCCSHLINRCCLLNLLTFDEFERVMRTVEKVCWKHFKMI